MSTAELPILVGYRHCIAACAGVKTGGLRPAGHLAGAGQGAAYAVSVVSASSTTSPKRAARICRACLDLLPHHVAPAVTRAVTPCESPVYPAAVRPAVVEGAATKHPYAILYVLILVVWQVQRSVPCVWTAAQSWLAVGRKVAYLAYSIRHLRQKKTDPLCLPLSAQKEALPKLRMTCSQDYMHSELRMHSNISAVSLPLPNTLSASPGTQ